MIQPESPIQMLGLPPAGPGPAAAGGGDMERKGGGLCAQARGFHEYHSSCEGLVHMKRSEWGDQLSGLTEKAGFSCLCMRVPAHAWGVANI